MSFGDGFRIGLGASLAWFLSNITLGNESYPDIGDELRGLEVWGSGDLIEDFDVGEVLILDFFAHWCGPCLEVSKELKQLEAGGFQLLPINVESVGPERTDAFLNKAGIERAYFDPDGNLSAALLIEALPFVALVEVLEEGEVAVRRIYRRFPGSETVAKDAELLRESNMYSNFGSFAKGNGLGRPSVANSVKSGAYFERYSSSDVEIANTKLSFNLSGRSWESTISIVENVSELNYTPSDRDLIGIAETRSESMRQFSLDVEKGAGDAFKALYSLGAYEGFTDYRSIWLDEFYRQQFEPVEGYEEADPKGVSLSIGGRWEYVPATATADFILGYQMDEISPAYEAAPFEPLRRGTSDMETAFASLNSENLVSRKLRVRQDLRFAETTSRSLRTQYSIKANYAASELWVARFGLGKTWESGSFRSSYWGASVERDVTRSVTVGAFGRRYWDSGEIKDPEILSTAAPELETRRWGLSIEWVWESISFRLMGGEYRTSYGELPDISFQFENLYRNRDWKFVNASGLLEF
ncbi:MAG: TlpA disulfide reductase family protein [Verrucomicrobiota bacterium]